MAVKQLTDTNFEAEVLKSDKPVMVDFYADWCGPCRIAAPIIEELSESNADKMYVGKLDVDANQQIAAEFGVMSIPTVIMFKDGKEVDRKIGFGGREGYESLIKKVA
jgi:thioredoxin 1